MYAFLTESKISPVQRLRIRYASPPTGALRWQAPQPPAVNRGKVLSAATLPQRCPQSPNFPLSVFHVALAIAVVDESITDIQASTSLETKTACFSAFTPQSTQPICQVRNLYSHNRGGRHLIEQSISSFLLFRVCFDEKIC